MQDRLKEKVKQETDRSVRDLIKNISYRSDLLEVQKVKRKRDIQVSFRLSEEEYSKLEEKAKIVNLSIPQFCKKASLSKKIKQPNIDNQGALKIASELRRIGLNVNQVAKHVNIDSNVSEGQIKALQEELGQIWQLFNSELLKI